MTTLELQNLEDVPIGMASFCMLEPCSTITDANAFPFRIFGFIFR